MANPLILKIAVDDKGNPAIINLGKNAQRAQQQVMPLGNVMKAVFTSAVVFKGIQLLTMGLRNAAMQALEFELAVKRIGAIGGVSGDKLAGLSELARKLAVETEYSAVSIANAGLEIKKMGFTAEQTMQALPTIVDLATASMSDLSEAAKNAMTTMRAFGLEATDMDRVANVMATTVVSTGIDFEDFTESMKYVAPIAKTVGMSLEETAAMMGILGNTAIKGSLGGTTLKNMFLNILKPSDNVREMLKQMDFEGKSFSDVLKELKDRGASTNDFLETFNKRAVAGALHLAGVSQEVNNLQKELEAQNKTVKEIADEIRDTTIIALKQLVNNFNEVVLSIWDAFGERPKNLIQGFTEAIKELDSWVDNNQEKIAAWGKNISETIIFLGDVGLNILKLVASNMRLIAIAVGLWAANWVKLNITQMATQLQNIGRQAGTAAASFNLYVAAITAGITAYSLLADAADRWSAKIDQQMKNIADLFGTKQHEEMLVAIKKAREEEQNWMNLREANKKTSHSFYKGIFEAHQQAKKELKELEKQYENTFGEAALRYIQNNKQLNGMLENFRRINNAVAKADKDAKANKPTSFNFGEIPPSEDKKGKKELSQEAQDYIEHLGHIYVLEQNIAAIDKEILKTQKALNEVEEEIRDKYVDEQIELFKKAQEIREANREVIRDSMFSSIQSGLDIAINLNQMALNETLDRLAEEEKAVERRYAIETAAAEGNAYAKEQAETRYQSAKKSLDDKRQREEQAARQKEKFIAIAKATADATQAIIGVLADSRGGTLSRAAMAAAMTSIAFGYVANLTAAYANYRHGSAGLIDGVGNSTSDSNLARVSNGERVLSTDEIKQLGGNEKIQQMIDRGTSVTNNSPVNVYVDTLIGTKQFVGDYLIPAVEKELSR